MGSKYRIVPTLLEVFADLRCQTILDAFSGSGVVGYALKALGKSVVANDFLSFPATLARATIANSSVTLGDADIARILQSNRDGRDFIQRTFAGLYFPPEDLAFLDAAWSQIAVMSSAKRDVAVASLCLASARKQPRGVFTVTDFRYDDGRRQLRAPLRDLFVEAVAEYNAAVFNNGNRNRAVCKDVFALSTRGIDAVYLDPPYAPPRDDNDYIKRYHFLEGLSVYWQGLRILTATKTQKIEKRYTPFAYKSTIRGALRTTFHRFRRVPIVLSYSSNSVPCPDEVLSLMKEVKNHVEVRRVAHRYSFGTHAQAVRREAEEYIFVGR
jgi:adenine-specific DNA-methyltransferase